MPTDYDIGAAFDAIENELISSMVRNLKHHRAEETKEGFQWSQWQAEQLDALEAYKRQNQKKYGRQFRSINRRLEQAIRAACAEGEMEQEEEILNAIREGFSARRMDSTLSGSFFRLNERKLDALIKSTTSDMEKAETAILRRVNDQYRKIIFNAQVYANTGAGTYEKAVDMATKDFLSAGIQCVVYQNGARHTLSDYADMALRTASKRAYLQGEGTKRQEWGISTVIINKRSGACPDCAKFCGKVFIDDVWSGGEKSDGNYPLLSSAIAQGLYHPRCKDGHSTFFPDITREDQPWTREELAGLEQREKREQKQQHAQRQAEKFRRLEQYSLDEENQKKYGQRAEAWEEVCEGLGAGNSGSTGFDAPEMVKIIDSKDTERMMEELEKAQTDFAQLEHEENLTVTEDGKVWHTKGSKGGVNPWNIERLGSSLKNSYSYHNHPPDETHYSLSEDDVRFFFDSGQRFSKAADDIYEYIMVRTEKTLAIDGETAYHRFREIYTSDIYELSWDGLIDIDEDGYHETMKRLSEEYHFLYARRKLNARKEGTS